ncbi:chromosome segregation protein Csm1/Pcs1-domain-containing protein [Annulohypoxylon maeteangense]|uniref:chromosome segregation protein Csm1/Pcs1-domain-containing protein n=1 Tax=Annulohypoxylon maeteangense TaxID=1927788 RepID=UPI002008201E|nr:chromosome segregation protein Csm1/Pcs1-domain-containing protein [Annulohypoxylon maeteangense]KAI0888856.1 chromosome segregation protein Csm1/Pcs1-domain-containing protein [Annulohypoxylon maeteangense]
MPKVKGVALRGLVESDDEAADILGEDTVVGAKMAPAKTRTTGAKGAAKATQNATRQTSGKTAASKALARKVLADKPANVQDKPMRGKGKKRAAPEETTPAVDDEDDEISMAVEEKPKGGRGRPRAAKAAKISNDSDISTVNQPEPAAQPTGKRGRKPKAKDNTPPPEKEIPETQPAEREIPETQAVETTELSVEEHDRIEDLPSHQPVLSSIQRPQSRDLFGTDRRGVSASDSDEPAMRRRVGDLTRKYESLEAKYRDLREIGVKEAERNYDLLKKQSEDKANTANQLIATLKAQLSTQTELAKETQRLKQQLEASQTKVEELQNKVDDTNASLTGAKTEIKTLTTKLSAARSAETVTTKVPGSAIKGNNNLNNRLLANAEASAHIAQMKEDLYGDLTGLIVRGVKREENGGDTYDCIQTGRNGTLHFKLAVGCDETSENPDEPQFVYMPQLDPNRDEDLVDMLPDYLIEEISFPQSHAARFYARVMRSLTERPE